MNRDSTRGLLNVARFAGLTFVGHQKGGAVMRLTSMFVFALAVTQSACVMVGGYSSEGGWWIWPGSLISLLVVVVVVFLLLRRRR